MTAGPMTTRSMTAGSMTTGSITAGIDDSDARRRIAHDLDDNLMVVAGAGTGKTTALVGRVMALVRSGAAALAEIAAITFTEAAAAELRQQVRQAVVAGADEGDERMVAARREVDDAAICTLHSFAQRILLEQYIDAGLPPGFDVLDDTAEAADFDLRWSQFADSLLDDPGAEWALVLGFSLGLRHTDLAAVAWNLHGQWDRLEDGGLDYLSAARGCDRHWPLIDPGPVIDALDRARAAVEWCTDAEDKMAVHLGGTVTEARTLLATARHDPLAALQLLDTLPPLRCAHGRQENWTGHIAEVRAACAEAEQIRLDVLDEVRRAVLGDLVARVATFTVSAAEQRRTEGRLTFHDLLVHARRLVRAEGDGVETLRRRYRRILIDEFQDTDPIQVELAARLTAAGDGGVDIGGARSGALFVVGDPKQSIYRFRRADIDLFERVRADIGSTAVLRTNFRSVPGIVTFINVVFSEILGHGDIPGQARHHALLAARPAPTGGATGGVAGPGPVVAAPVQLSFDGIDSSDIPAPRRRRGARGSVPAPAPSPPAPVVVVGSALAVSTPEVRRRAATDAAAAIAHMVSGEWPVHDGEGQRGRPARWRDIAVLIPARSSLAALEAALEDAGVPYRLEGAALLWGAEEVREVLAVLRAADDPADAVAVLGALRSPGLACGDDDLVTWYAAGGTWDPRAAPPPGLDRHPVAEAMAVLDRLHRQRWWSEPSAMVGAAYRELRSFELALSHRRPRDYWHRLRWLQDQARLFDESVGGTVRAFLAWAAQRVAGDGRVGGVGPPDPDDDAVRVMTIHGAKGLEFPIVVLAGLERDPADGPPPPAVLWTEHHIPEVHVGRFRTSGYEQAGLREQHLDRLEQHRLLYVGMTRARDHLVVCLHHKQRNGIPDASLAALVTAICADNRTLWRPLPDGAITDGPASAPDDARRDRRRTTAEAGGPGQAPDAVPLPERWEADRLRLLASRRRRPVTTATAVAEDRASPTTTGPRAGAVPDDPAWPRSPAVEGEDPDVARRVGRAVHVALAAIDLTTGTDAEGATADEVAAVAARAEDVSSRVSEVVAMVEAALASPTVARGAWRRHWREVPVTVPIGVGGLLEGYVDLLLQDDEGLVVVDYKTDRIHGHRALSDAAAAYRLQVAAYAMALESSTGLNVHRCVLVFAGADEPCEHVFEGQDLAAARDEARRVAETLVTT
jgi:ATP-dependent helicase/nuclease subunit A